MLKLLLKLSTLSLGISCVVCTTASSQTQLASLNERLGQVLSSLYASPLLTKTSTSTSSAEEIPTPSTAPETSYMVTSGPPQVVYVSPSPYLEAGAQPNDYGYQIETHPVARSAWPHPYEYAYPSQYSSPAFPSPYPAARPPYPEASRLAYPQIPAPNLNPSLASSFQSPASYPAPVSFSSPVPYPSPVPITSPVYPPAPFPSLIPPVPYPQSVYPSVHQPPSLAYSPASPFPYPSACTSPTSYPQLGFPSPLPYLGYQSPLPQPGYPALTLPPQTIPPPQYSSLPSTFPLGFPALLPSPVFNSAGYPSPVYSSPPFSPPAYPKYSEVLHHPFDFSP